MNNLPVALSIAGSDSGGGAGIQADLLTFATNGVFGTTAITCLTAQNPAGVSSVSPVAPEFVAEQVRQVFAFFGVTAIKTGMLHNAGIVAAVAGLLRDRPEIPAVVDPVMVSTSGAALLLPDAVNVAVADLFPRASLITPNLDEATALLGWRPNDIAGMQRGSLELARRYGTAVLLKGGHLPGDNLTDILALPDGVTKSWASRRIEGVDTHGSGCTLAAAIAANLAKGLPLMGAVAAGRDYLQRGLANAVPVGGRRYIAHLA
jgi:hydroxymethylpyrimidine/phosphomethylpyrimidine kinase